MFFSVNLQKYLVSSDKFLFDVSCLIFNLFFLYIYIYIAYLFYAKYYFG